MLFGAISLFLLHKYCYCTAPIQGPENRCVHCSPNGTDDWKKYECVKTVLPSSLCLRPCHSCVAPPGVRVRHCYSAPGWVNQTAVYLTTTQKKQKRLKYGSVRPKKATGEPAFRQPCEGTPKPALWSICRPLLAVRVIAHTSAASHFETLSVKTPNNGGSRCGPNTLHQTVCEKSGMFQANKATCGSVNLSVDMLGRRQPSSCFKLVWSYKHTLTSWFPVRINNRFRNQSSDGTVLYFSLIIRSWYLTEDIKTRDFCSGGLIWAAFGDCG